MSSSTLIRWSGLTTLIGGILVAVLNVAFSVLVGDQPESVVATTTTWGILLVLSLVATGLVFLGLVGLYAHQVTETGVLGLIAFLVSFSGTALFFGFMWTDTFVVPVLAEVAPEFLDTTEAGPSGVLAVGIILTFVLFALGWLLFGLASLLAGVLPRGASVLLIIGVVLSYVLGVLALPFSEVVFGVALAWMGYALWTGAGEQAAAPQPAA